MTEAAAASLKGHPLFEIARRDAKIERLTQALAIIARGDEMPMQTATNALGFEMRMDEDYERG